MKQFKPFSALVLSDLKARQVLGNIVPPITPGEKGTYTEVYRCDNCREIHDWQEDAEDCCAEDAVEARESENCPACGKESESYRDATDCCMWKNLDALKRWAIADRVECGETWLEAIEAETGQLIN